MTAVNWLVANTIWRFVFFWKKITGFIDLQQTITVIGTVINTENPDLDADRNFDVELDPSQEKYITGFGGRLTFQRAAGRPSIHCEISPWMPRALRDLGATLVVGDRVRVTGAWGFDGVHTGHSIVIEILLAILRHGPNVRAGWFEIHSVTALEILK